MQGKSYHSGRAISILELCIDHAKALAEAIDAGNGEVPTALEVKIRLQAFEGDYRSIMAAIKLAYKEGEFSGGW